MKKSKLPDNNNKTERAISYDHLAHCLTTQGRCEESLLLLVQLRFRLARQPLISDLLPELCFELMRAYRRMGLDLGSLQEQYGDCFAHISLESLFHGQQDREAVFALKCQLLMLVDDGDELSALNYAMQGLIKSMQVGDLRHRILFSGVKALCEFKQGRYSEARESMNGAMVLAQRFQFQYVIAEDDFGWSDLWRIMDKNNDFEAQLSNEFISGLRALIAKKDHMSSSPASASPIAETVFAHRKVRSSLRPDCFGLTEKELKILSLLTEGLCNKRIARRSEIALTTVKWHLQNIFGKLEVRNRTEAVVKAQELALVNDKA
ncbi:response regulator transcription factor [Ketobacter sp. MCCC 1A13808]|uniref:helix-turn-helix transcriptional regulator n=1 Tax=Ketobacter sp. MCCC 1A13808 TaxID=2602738 RepID=UPI0012EB9CA8|nr:LuxR C-terminal-related transcriptional regulator [Ketobacter sp. MCCC 1A13808]MVF12205.1 response regulator transcription factor [Ketobacter sp. MCCC 1A13808]